MLTMPPRRVWVRAVRGLGLGLVLVLMVLAKAQTPERPGTEAPLGDPPHSVRHPALAPTSGPRKLAVAGQHDSLRTLALPTDSNAYAVVRQVLVEGNRKTRRPILLREMGLQEGDTVLLLNLPDVLERQRRLLLNTGLFSEAEALIAALDPEAHSLTLRVVVREKWYLYPSVAVDLADRNFNVWWTEQNRDLSRINLGVKLRHRNITGRADRLSLGIQTGYTRKAEITYQIPYIDRAKLVGLELNALADRNREWNFRTVGGEQDFFSNDTSSVLNRRRLRAGITLRPGLYTTHLFSIERQVTTADSVLATEINTNFLGDALRRQAYYGFFYQYTYDKRDVRPFPLRGDYFRFRLHKRGLRADDDLNRLDISAEYAHYQPLGERLNLAVNLKVKTDIQRDPVPYYNRESLGFGQDFLRGYQYYIVDGLDFAFAKTTLRARVFDQVVKVPASPIRLFQEVPLRVFLGVHGDVGGARDPSETAGNVLANEVLRSYGFGLYGNAWYGQVLSVEFSRNHLGEWGWYLGFTTGF